MGLSLSEVLSEFAASLDGHALPNEVVDRAKLLFADWAGSAVRGHASPLAVMALSALGNELGPGRATLLGSCRRTTPLWAAFFNGYSSHILEYDDTHRNSLYHPGAPTIPPALAAAEHFATSGQDFLAGMVAGYEVGIRIADAVNPSHYQFWHTTGTVGTFGAAAAAGRVLACSSDQIAHALGNAGTQAAGLWQFQSDAAMSKPLHAGKAAMNGLLAVLMAARGITGARRILEGEQGFCRAMASEWEWERITADLGTRYRILEVTFKMYPSCGHTHTAIDAALALRDRLALAASEIVGKTKRLEVFTNSVAVRVAGCPRPRTSHEARFSIPYCVAYALLYGAPDLDAFEAPRLHDPLVVRLLGRTELLVSAEFEEVFRRKRPTEIRLYLDDGTVAQAKVDFRLGDPENPAQPDQVRSKFLRLVGPILGPAGARALWDNCMGVERVTDMSRFFEECTREADQG